jgi:hypothetical protein
VAWHSNPGPSATSRRPRRHPAPLATISTQSLTGFLVLCLPRLTVFVSIKADRHWSWFPGPLGPYTAWFPGINLSREYERVKVPGTPMKSPFCFGVFWGSNSCDHHLRAWTAESCKKLDEWPLQSTKRNLSFAGIIRGVRCSHFSVRILPTISFFLR